MAKRVSVLCTHMHSQFGEKREKKLGRGPTIKSPLKQWETEESEERNEKQTQRKKDQRLQLTERHLTEEMAEESVLNIFLVTGGSGVWWEEERRVLTLPATTAPLPPLERACSN